MSVSVEGVKKTYQSPEGEISAVEDISLEIRDGEFISVVGPSGCGKSTLLSIIAGLDKPSAGRVVINGEEIHGPNGEVGFMPQKDQLFPWRTIWANVTLGLEIQGKKTKERLEHVRELLQRYGLGEFMKKTPGQLSGGMRQRCALIRTLATDPELLLLDEPFSALDYQTRLSVSDDIYTIIKQEKKTAILVTHDISESISMSDRVVVLTGRPSRIRSIHSLDLFSGLTPIERRNHPEFRSYFNAIWGELDESK